ncbi:MAG: hypothetical protein WBQ75_10940 [Acetobacteraceae bacterium]
MGTDFIQRVGKTLKRSRDEARIRIAAPDLTTRELIGGARGIPAVIVNGAKLTAGQLVTLERDGGAIVARQAITVVARNNNPSAGALEAMARHQNILAATVSVVHDVAEMVEITLSC